MGQTFRDASEAIGLLPGEQSPDFKAKDQHGNIFHLNSILKKTPVVLIFYRGHWCPLCNKHLNEIQEKLIEIQNKGATIVAVTPEKAEFIDKTIAKTGAKFFLLHDSSYTIANAFDVTFRPDSISRLLYNTVLKANLKEAHDDASQRLPIPATYIIGQDRKIVWRHFDPDYKKRSSVTDILEHLP